MDCFHLILNFVSCFVAGVVQPSSQLSNNKLLTSLINLMERRHFENCDYHRLNDVNQMLDWSSFWKHWSITCTLPSRSLFLFTCTQKKQQHFQQQVMCTFNWRTEEKKNTLKKSIRSLYAANEVALVETLLLRLFFPRRIYGIVNVLFVQSNSNSFTLTDLVRWQYKARKWAFVFFYSKVHNKNRLMICIDNDREKRHRQQTKSTISNGEQPNRVWLPIKVDSISDKTTNELANNTE